jgi:hypothetical protein
MSKYLLLVVSIILLHSCVDEGSFEPTDNIVALQYESKYKINSNEKVLIHTKEYNEEGFLIKFTKFNDESVSSISEFDYFDGKRIERFTDVVEGNEKRVEYIEDGSGKVGQINRYDTNGDLVGEEFLEYDENGQLLKRSGSVDGSIPQLFDYETDANGRISLISVFDLDNSLVSYDSLSYNGNNITRFTKNGEGNLVNRVEFEYNDYGKLLSEKVYDSENKISSYYVYEYQYFSVD